MFGFFFNFIERCIRCVIIFITNFLPVKVISDERGRPFLYRYQLVNWGDDGPGLCIHHFIASDPDRGYHDHPWKSAISFILAGGYEERILNDDKKTFTTVNRKRWTFNCLDGINTFHRVMIPEGGDAWTIFAFKERTKLWGMVNLEGEFHHMSRQIKDADGGWWREANTGYNVDHHIEHSGKVVPTVDIVIYCEISKKDFNILLIKRGKEPFKDHLALPGGRIEQKDKDVMDAAKRELKEETSLVVDNLDFNTMIGNNHRDPRGFFLTAVFSHKFDEMPKVRAGDDARDYTWIKLSEIDKYTLAFDHKYIIKNFNFK